MFSLGEKTNPSKSKTSQFFQLGQNLTRTCYESYSQSPSGLGGEIVKAAVDNFLTDGRYSLRPETIESIFYMYRFTKNEMYREWGWKIIDVYVINSRAWKQNAAIMSGIILSTLTQRLSSLFFWQKPSNISICYFLTTRCYH
jgi:hypothetical protein